jgi:TetR/AcrR family transcriptional repressor of nem operon
MIHFIMKKPAAEMRQHILDVAKSLMINKGYTAVGLAEVVAAAGVPKGSFYYYFRSKEEFGQALLEEYFAVYLSTIDELLAGEGKAARRLLSYFRYWIDSQRSPVPDGKCLVVKLGPEVCDLSEDMRVVLEKGTGAVVERLGRCIEEGQSDGSISSDMHAEALAKSLYQLWLGASLQAKVDNARAPFDTALAMTERMLF